MRSTGTAVGAGLVTCLVAVTSMTSAAAAQSGAGQPAASAVQAAAVAPGVTAFYEMNEPAGATVMTDSGRNGLSAAIDPLGVQTGSTVDGATGYTWVHRPPEQAPPSPERIIQVPDNINLEPGNGPFTIELRYRTEENFGNITQKGQATTPGGQWKIQNPGGIPSCLFQGSVGQVATAAKTPLNDEQWHNLTCVLTSTGVTMYVDGVYRSRKNGSTGTIDNAIPMTIGGKINCDQIEITCDYFSGQIDFIKITKAANLQPTAAFSSACLGRVCTFDAAASADADGSLARYAWSFGDGTTSTATNPSHTFPSGGSYSVALTVTDNQAATDSETHPLTVVDTPVEDPIDFVGSATSAANTSKPTVTVPAGVTPGDRLIMALSINSLSRTVSAPTGVTGWTLLDTAEANSMGTTLWTKAAAAGDAGKAVSVPLSAVTKYSLTVAAYTGTATGSAVAYAKDTNVTTVAIRSAPAVTTPAGAWVVSYWADKSSTTTAWTPSASVTARTSACGADGGRICSALADSAVGVPAGTNPPVSATTGTPSDMATMWSVVLAPSGAPPGNQKPTASFTSTCTLLDCTFSSAGSTDSDGVISTRSWTFGDGATSNASTPAHTYASAGAYLVTLVVTDDDGANDSTTKTVTVAGTPVDSPVDFVGTDFAAGNTGAPKVTVPAAAAVGDRLVLVLSLNNVSRTVSAPTGVTGWTQLDTIVADSMGTTVWTKVLQAGDAGKAVTVPLSGVAKFTLTVSDYSGVATTPSLVFARTTDLVNHTGRSTPAVTTPAGAWVLSYWADKSSTTTTWTPAGTVATRGVVCGADGGRICSALADSGAPVAAGTYGPVTATTNAASNAATLWSIVLPPA